jgi:hypothetical protein
MEWWNGDSVTARTWQGKVLFINEKASLQDHRIFPFAPIVVALATLIRMA